MHVRELLNRLPAKGMSTACEGIWVAQQFPTTSMEEKCINVRSSIAPHTCTCATEEVGHNFCGMCICDRIWETLCMGFFQKIEFDALA